MSRKFTRPSPEARARESAGWEEAVRLKQFVYGEMSFIMSISIPQAMWIVREWEEAGKVQRIGPPHRFRNSKLVFEVVAPGEIVKPMGGDLYQQMWTVMRKLPSFTPIDLTSHAAVTITNEQASAYCQLLLAGGYLRVLAKAKPFAKEAIYQLVLKTGVEAPRERRMRCLIDPNTSKITPLAEVGQ